MAAGSKSHHSWAVITLVVAVFLAHPLEFVVVCCGFAEVLAPRELLLAADVHLVELVVVAVFLLTSYFVDVCKDAVLINANGCPKFCQRRCCFAAMMAPLFSTLLLTQQHKHTNSCLISTKLFAAFILAGMRLPFDILGGITPG